MADTRYYTIPKGRLWFKKANDTSYIDLGNLSELKISVETEMVEHFSSRGPNKVKDWEHLNSFRSKWSGMLEELNVDNLKLFLVSDSTETITQTGATVAAEAHADVEPGRGYKLAYHTIENAVPSTVAVKKGLTTYTEGSDYEIDYTEGILYIKPGGTIASGDDITIDYTSEDVTGYTQINGNSRTNYEGDFLFVGNPGAGQQLTIKGYVSFQPTGDLPLLSDELVKLSVQGEFLSGHGYGKNNGGEFEVVARGYVS